GKSRAVGAPSSLGERFVQFAGLVVGAGFLFALAGMGATALYFNYLGRDLPDYKVLAAYEPPVTTRVYAGDGALVAEFARERRIFVPVEAIPDRVKNAFIAAEDKNFRNHAGIDFKGVLRAQISNVGNIAQGRRLEGGSTITQQVAKNFLLSSEQKIERKLKEWLITRRMERAYSKDQILELYLNEIYLGNRSYGVAAAALNYFGKSLDDLDVREAAYLAAIPKGPSNYHPVRNRDRAIERRNWVVGRMVEDGYISAIAGEAARAQDLGASVAPDLGARDWASGYFAEEVRKRIAELYGVEALYDGGLAVRTTLDPNLQKAAGAALRAWLVEYDQRHGWRGPLGGVAIDGDWAEALNDAVDDLMKGRRIADDLAPWRPAVVLAVADDAATIGFPDGAEGRIPLAGMAWAREYLASNKQGPEVTSVTSVLRAGDVVLAEPDRSEEAGARDYLLRQTPAVNGGLVAIDPHTGRVLAMVGGFSFEMSEFNRAMQARRQRGSTFKPFVYAAALDSGYTPSSRVLDAPFVAPGVDSWYKPGNYVEGQYAGLSTLRHGIEKSRNTMTARLAQDLGIGRILDYVDRFNLSDDLPRELAISLGAGETTLMRMTAAYATFVNGGRATKPFLIDRIQDRRGRTIYRNDGRLCPYCDADAWTAQVEPQLPDEREQVMDPRTAYQMVSMLEGAVARGTGTAVRKVVAHPVAGKTGTTNEYKDAWFVGFTPDLAAGVYVGFDLPQSLGQGEAGGRVAAPVFGDFMQRALEEVAPIPFRVPSGVRLVRVDAKTGKPANGGGRSVILEAFKADEPVDAGPSPEELTLDPLSAAPQAQAADEENDEDFDGIY
ncbi:MAG: penicillin-binding protein 1A, partial [Pseudomonadota bacterium]